MTNPCPGLTRRPALCAGWQEGVTLEDRCSLNSPLAKPESGQLLPTRDSPIPSLLVSWLSHTHRRRGVLASF